MEFKPSDQFSETSPLIEPVDHAGDGDLFMVPLKRPSPKLPSSQYGNGRPMSPSRSPAAPSRSPSARADPEKSPQPTGPQLAAGNYQGSPMSGCTVKPDSPPMFISPLMSPESGVLGIDGILASHVMGTPGSLLYNSPPLSGENNTKTVSSPVIPAGSTPARQSPGPPSSSSKEEDTTSASRSTGDKPNQSSTKPSSVDNDCPPVVVEQKPDLDAGEPPRPPELPPRSGTRYGIASGRNNQLPPPNLGLALDLPDGNDRGLLAPPPDRISPRSPLRLPSSPPPRSPGGGSGLGKKTAATGSWAVPESPLERLSQVRATPDSAYDRARQMELRRSEWKHVVYRFPVRGADDWVIDADLTESSHARLAEVARRSGDGFEWNGDYELANIYRVLAAAHTRVMEQMRAERRGVRL
ncbi:hypothetical protein MYCTH_2113991 [Thermothelomyces thermophilus ATCC 42464]|uniref:Uncharacterized protein n=1 Tax=Thermothelomyces thermophilus (strain ATCC 42464 / BCRC 31852 / DSM 1799) TaxID=573729 RepID=G2QNV7_THET4|nr:uncharacterized protein MYCTH_2113991 [Thermothelomyces thermophilus ATCC 42464]AEO62133.1 hypothetical protein MYCTH_2113991 [Thermothelomyces thermophilus ATCC 42464]